jgi:hypothetical protein
MYPLKYPFPPPEVVEFYRVYFGPVNRAFVVLDADGQAALQRDLEQLWSTYNRTQDNSTHVESEYLKCLQVDVSARSASDPYREGGHGWALSFFLSRVAYPH